MLNIVRNQQISCTCGTIAQMYLMTSLSQAFEQLIGAIVSPVLGVASLLIDFESDCIDFVFR